MSFVELKTGNVFKNIEQILDKWCGEGCKGKKCPINNLAEKVEMSSRECYTWASEHPEIAAKILGFGIIQNFHNMGKFAKSKYRLSRALNLMEIDSEETWKQQRYDDLCKAIGACIICGSKPNKEWILEGQRMVECLKKEVERDKKEEDVLSQLSPAARKLYWKIVGGNG